MQFKSYSLNDSIWVKYSQVVDKVPVVTQEPVNLSARYPILKSGVIRTPKALDHVSVIADTGKVVAEVEQPCVFPLITVGPKV